MKINLILLFAIVSSVVYANKNFNLDDSFFIENKGQWPSDVLFLCRSNQMDAWITKSGINYSFYGYKKNSKDSFINQTNENDNLIGHRILMKFHGININPQIEGLKKQGGYYNYLIGNNPNNHFTNVGLYKEVYIKDIYDGIDIRYYFQGNLLRFDFIVSPGGNPEKIKFTFQGENSLKLRYDNVIVLSTELGDVEIKDLHTYQGNKKITSKFVEENNYLGISVDNYKKDELLIIDPLVYSTYLNGSSDDFGQSIVLDNNGNVFITGSSKSGNYSTTPGVFQPNQIFGYEDVIVTKINSNGSDLIFSTFIGGSNVDIGYGIDIDNDGNSYITGKTLSNNFPTTSGAFQENISNISFYEAFVAKLNPTGTALVYSTYMGGSNDDIAHNIKVDDNGYAIIVGSTQSSDFDTTASAYQTTLAGNLDAFISKINTTGTGLVFSTLLGGANDEVAKCLDIDVNGNIYVTGYTESADFDITTGAYQEIYIGYSDVFVTKLNSTGSSLIYSTYIGRYYDDEGYGIAVDADGNAYITGYTSNTNFPVTTGVFQTIYGGGVSDIFVLKLNSGGTGLIYSTFIGGSNREYSYGIDIDNTGCAYITGYAYVDYPITTNADQTSGDGFWSEVIVTKLDPTASTLLYSSYLGGNGGEEGRAIVAGSSGEIYITGCTWSTNFDVTSGAFQTTGGANFALYDVFVTKINVGTTSSMHENNVYSMFYVYPNPSHQEFTIISNQSEDFELIDVSGKRIDRIFIKENEPLNYRHMLPKGVYILRGIASGTMRKIVVQ
ncbi:MAG: SBBP repeat-containing protein [Flavobacteriales bacterium]|nr:SBBP repeat-containing protein [Flavobacteriales bacterium]